MDRAGPRLPSPWWVLVPGVLLALAGARAVTAEVDRARTEQRERIVRYGESAARTFATLVEEYGAPLEDVAGPEDVADRTRHLYPSWAFDAEGALLDATPPPDVDAATVEREAALRDDVLDRVAREPADVAASVLSAAAEVVVTPWLAAELRAGAAEADALAGLPAEALEQVRRILDQPPAWLRATEAGHPADRALSLLAMLPLDEGAPEWVTDAVVAAAADAWGLGEAARARHVEELLAAIPDTAGVLRHRVRLAEQLRAHVRRLEPGARDRDVFLLSGEGDEPRVALLRRAGDATSRLWVGGVIPERTVVERLRQVEGWSSRVRAPDGTVLDPYPEVQRPFAPGGISTLTPLPDLPGWAVETHAHRISAVPTSAWFLGGAVGLATLALIAGALALHRAARSQARLAEERRTFLDHVAHEVRTPAAALLALSEELERGHVDAERQPAYHAHLLSESRRLADLVEETLDLARLEGGRLVATREPADLRDVVRDAVDAARPDEGRVVVTLPDAAVPVEVDRAAVRRAVRNLVDNALRHGAAPPAVEVTLSPGGVLTVRDHGRGIPQEHLGRVFERFHRIPSPTHEVKGVGLGLALVREVAEVHGGSVAAENATGGGARFTLRLPVATGGRA